MPPTHDFTLRSLARLTMSHEAYILSERFLAACGTDFQPVRGEFSFAKYAQSRVHGAEAVLRYAVVLARTQRTPISWASISRVVQRDESAVVSGCQIAEKQFRDAIEFANLTQADGAGKGLLALPDGLDDPLTNADQLDKWAAGGREHSLFTNLSGLDSRPVSRGLIDGLASHDPTSRLIARAWLVLEGHNARASDAYRRLAVTYDDSSVGPIGLLRRSAALLRDAERSVEQAVVLDAALGAGWGQIGSALGIKADEAQGRYEGVIKKFSDVLDVADGGQSKARLQDRGVPTELIDPVGAARRLDDWLVRGGGRELFAALRIVDTADGLVSQCLVSSPEDLAQDLITRADYVRHSMWRQTLPGGVSSRDARVIERSLRTSSALVQDAKVSTRMETASPFYL